MTSTKYQQFKEKLTGNTFKHLEQIALDKIKLFTKRKEGNFAEYIKLKKQKGIESEEDVMIEYVKELSNAAGKKYLTKKQIDRLEFYLRMMDKSHGYGVGLTWREDF